MKTNIIAFSGIGLLVLFALAFVSIFEIRLASAQVNATSSPLSSTDATTNPSDLVASTSTELIANGASSTLDLAVTSTAAASSSPDVMARYRASSTRIDARSYHWPQVHRFLH